MGQSTYRSCDCYVLTLYFFSGYKNYIVTRIKRNLSHVVQMHCVNHRRELRFRDTARNNTSHKKLDNRLPGLFYFHHNSSLNRTNLKASFAVLDTRPVMPTRVGGTRWMGRLLRSLNNFVKGYKAVVQQVCKK